MQGTDIANKGGAPGAVVTVKCDYRAVSFAIGIAGIIYEVSKFGGARIATVAGLYCLVKKRVYGGYQLISMLSSMVQARRSTLLPH